MAFSGWPEEALDFYDGLAADNTKTWWTAHKAIYTDKVLRPMTDLAEELAAEFGEPKIFRPYRDVRFSPDKTPYKTHIGAVIGGTGYVQLSAEGLGAGAGMWEMNPEQLARYREAVAGDRLGAELEEIVAELEKADVTVHGHGALKSAPRGYPADHPRITLLRYKGLTAWLPRALGGRGCRPKEPISSERVPISPLTSQGAVPWPSRCPICLILTTRWLRSCRARRSNFITTSTTWRMSTTAITRSREPSGKASRWSISLRGRSATCMFNNAGQHYNHIHFWKWMKPKGGGKIPGEVEKALKDGFGSVDKAKEDLIQAGVTQFGSGWAWLTLKDGKLSATKTANGESPLVHGGKPILGVDVWEHSYYIDYRNRRPDYLKAFFDSLVNWEYVAEMYGEK